MLNSLCIRTVVCFLSRLNKLGDLATCKQPLFVQCQSYKLQHIQSYNLCLGVYKEELQLDDGLDQGHKTT